MPDYLTRQAVQALAGEPVAVVRVRNLHGVVRAAADAWGRPDKPQPALVSAELSFCRPFASVAVADRLAAGGSAHYGDLSKLILQTLERFGPATPSSVSPPTLRSLLDALWLALTGHASPRPGDSPPENAEPPFLDLSGLRCLSVTVTLPKASLLGQGVSLTASSVFGPHDSVLGYATALRLHELRVPTLVGVNPNERLAKQVVVADVEIDKCYPHDDTYTSLERLVVKTLEESSFETLEALGSQLARDILNNFQPVLQQDRALLPPDWRVRISLEKPTAVPFADCPAVELSVAADEKGGGYLDFYVY